MSAAPHRVVRFATPSINPRPAACLGADKENWLKTSSFMEAEMLYELRFLESILSLWNIEDHNVSHIHRRRHFGSNRLNVYRLCLLRKGGGSLLRVS